mmetsp:Transcript_127440/g.368988  ORF Transcript_127440/g.368988 Transcript_127440/m.368988 type:complete len:194 (+) Transcript_127440:71-652(+)|eukprot:CAMPEP_0176083530 /NCGR_PEP_ID=MMETSP0120_2-20121206/41791_1 /TAXON_ID=160619 /ORGANISM="Kryptoperidinium foliaceum, Strain CCMP 1326" /LENGTH=193 /DNA_ID=CAMNT_0017417315 /DNA_START=11 /DNA_END=592 /DNA_ORIENTATION=-
MEIIVVETGNLPADTIISFHSGGVRRHAQVQMNKAISLSSAVSSEPVRVDLMSQIGSTTFDMVPGQEIYDVQIGSEGRSMRLKVQIREAPSRSGTDPDVSSGVLSLDEGELNGPGSPSRKLQTALSMRSYLDNHDVLRNVQDMLEELVINRPADPLEFMINKLEQVCGDVGGTDGDDDGDAASGAPKGVAIAP